MGNIWPSGETAKEIYDEDRRQEELNESIKKQWADWPQSRALRRHHRESPFMSALLRARSLSEEGKRSEAFDAFLGCADMAIKEGDSHSRLLCLFSCAMELQLDGQYEESARAYRNLTPLVEQIGDEDSKAMLYFHRGTANYLAAASESKPVLADALRESMNDYNRSLRLYHDLDDYVNEHRVIDNMYIAFGELERIDSNLDTFRGLVHGRLTS